MRIKELIEQLKEYDENTNVFFEVESPIILGLHNVTSAIAEIEFEDNFENPHDIIVLRGEVY